MLEHPSHMLATASGSLVTRRGSALQTLPRRQAYWIAGQVGAATLTAILALWTLQPEIALTLSLAAGAASVNPKRLWAVPVVATGVTLVGLLCYAMAWPVVIGAGAAAGAFATWQIPQRTDWLDYVNNALATLTGSSIGLWLASLLVPEALPVGAVAVMTAGVGFRIWKIHFDLSGGMNPDFDEATVGFLLSGQL